MIASRCVSSHHVVHLMIIPRCALYHTLISTSASSHINKCIIIPNHILVQVSHTCYHIIHLITHIKLADTAMSLRVTLACAFVCIHIVHTTYVYINTHKPWRYGDKSQSDPGPQKGGYQPRTHMPAHPNSRRPPSCHGACPPPSQAANNLIVVKQVRSCGCRNCHLMYFPCMHAI
jgi:hypothetical protein